MTEGVLLKPLPERDWRTYTQGVIESERLFDNLLADLVAPFAPDPSAPKPRGRPAIPLNELVWVAVKKAQTGRSARRNHANVLDAEQEGLLAHAPRYNAAMEFLNRDDAEGILRSLVRASALPLAGIEQDFAVDSTGFTTGTFGTYKQQRYGQRKTDWRRDWVRLHACVGVRFCIVTDAKVTATVGAGTGDLSNFLPLVEATAENFKVHEVSADAAYSSKANLHAVKLLGGEALIPFRGGNNTPGGHPHSGAYQSDPAHPGSAKTWRKAHAYFTLHEEEFLARYHKRSNVEATFGAIKQTLGERLKAKNPQAQRNEVLCKVIAWNIRCVVRAILETKAEAASGAGLIQSDRHPREHGDSEAVGVR
ncbi:MAG TPA: transposase [Candidatus Thermoplasmatota archaeon]|nr:transposase [Candidatus Thermoplasmatota archaeon]